jgi:hypothetical protein
MKLYQEMKIVKNSKDSEHGSWYRKALVLSGAEGGFHGNGTASSPSLSLLAGYPILKFTHPPFLVTERRAGSQAQNGSQPLHGTSI